MVNRTTLLPPDIAFDALEQRGCGAWMGDHGCGAPTQAVMVGQTELYFAAYLCVHQGSGPDWTAAFLCARHMTSAEDREALTRDMAPKIRRNAIRELRKTFRLQGRKLGRPNLLEPFYV